MGISMKTPVITTAYNWCLFLFLFSYLLLRAFFNETLSDEAFSFLYYVEYGNFWGEKAHLDANNHLLNSFLSILSYRASGESHFFFVRLPNVLSFILYFWSVKRIADLITTSSLYRILILSAITCIPFIFEYFGFSRGYGLSMAFMTAGFYQLLLFQHNMKLKHFCFLLFFMTLSVYANLTLIITCLITISYALLLIVFQARKNIKLLLYSGLILLLFLPALNPIFNFSQQLRDGGALYYGSLNTLWESTVKSLLTYTVYSAQEWMFYPLLLILLTFAAYAFIALKREKQAAFIQPSAFFIWVLAGNLVAIELMAKILHINYPSDRVGMHLIIIFLFTFSSVFSQLRYGQYVLFLLVFFPVNFLFKLNLHSSTVSPYDRMTRSFYRQIMEKSDKYSYITMHPLEFLNYSIHSRTNNHPLIAEPTEQQKLTPDLVVVFKEQEHYLIDSGLYEKVAEDELKYHIAYKRSKPRSRSLILKESFDTNRNTDEFIRIDMRTIPDSVRNADLLFHFEALMECPNQEPGSLFVSFSFFDKEGVVHEYSGIPLQWIFGKKNAFRINYNNVQTAPGEQITEWRILLWNKERQPISLKNTSFELYRLAE